MVGWVQQSIRHGFSGFEGGTEFSLGVEASDDGSDVLAGVELN